MTRPSASLHPTSALPPLTPRMNGVAKTPSHVVSQKTKEPSTPSPNYFGLAVNSNADHFSSSAAQHIRGNWSPPTSNVRSTAAASPRIIPVEQNPEFEQFRKQSENNRAFALGSFDFASPGLKAQSKSPFFANIDSAQRRARVRPQATFPKAHAVDRILHVSRPTTKEFPSKL